VRHPTWWDSPRIGEVASGAELRSSPRLTTIIYPDVSAGKGVVAVLS
jgi:hypothetical protein